MKKILCLMLIIGTMLSLASCGKPEVSNRIDSVVIKGKTVELSVGDRLYADNWNDKDYTFNGETLKKCPYLFRGITIGTYLDKVISTFGLREGNAIVDREIATPEGDGTTEVITEVYSNTDFFYNEKVLDANFRFGYNEVEGIWVLVTPEQLKNGEAELEFNIDILGSELAADEPFEALQIIRFEVVRNDVD